MSETKTPEGFERVKTAAANVCFTVAVACSIVWLTTITCVFVMGYRCGWLSNQVFTWEGISLIPLFGMAVFFCLFYLLAAAIMGGKK